MTGYTIWILIAFVQVMLGPGQGFLLDDCAIMYDFDANGDVDMKDFAYFQNHYSCKTPLDCGVIKDFP